MKHKSGFTIVEIVLSLLIIAVVMYASISIFITAGVKGVNVEIFTAAQTLAEDKLEEAMASDFADVTSEAQANFSGDLSEYSHQLTVNYVSVEALDAPVPAATDYKKIIVSIRHPQLAKPTSLECIRGNI